MSSSNEVKAQAASDLVNLASPCELKEVATDVRFLAGNDQKIHAAIDKSMLDHSMEQFHQVTIPGTTPPTRALITRHGLLAKGKFLCPRTHSSFAFNVQNDEVSDVAKANPDNKEHGSAEFEDWRLHLEKKFTEYVEKHFKNGCVSVYAICGEKCKLIICTEASYAKNEMSGRWRSEYTIDLPEHPSGSELTIKGWIKVQTHLYEEGNVQLISSKEISLEMSAQNAEKFAQDLLVKIQHEEDVYQVAFSENFKTMSENTFKTLRRQLPLTKTKLDWNNIINYQIGSEITRSVV